MRYEKLNLKDGQVLKAEHLSHIEDGILEAQTHWEEVGITNVVEWDGDITGKETLIVDADSGLAFCNVSDIDNIAINDLIGGSLQITVDGNTIPVPLTSETVVQLNDKLIGVMFSGQPFAVITLENNATFDISGDGSHVLTIDKKGLWFLYNSSDPNITIGYTITIQKPLFISTIVKKIDNKFIDAEWMATKKNAKKEVIPETTMSNMRTGVRVTYTPFDKFTNCTVIWDGVEYECTTKTGFTGALVNVDWLVGRLSMLGVEFEADTDEPFAIFYLGTEDKIVVVAQDEESHTFSLVIDEIAYNKIPEAFLPSKATVYRVTKDLNDNLTSEEIVNIQRVLMDNIIVLANYHGSQGKIVHIEQYDSIDNFYTILFVECSSSPKMLMINKAITGGTHVTGLYNNKIVLRVGKWLTDGTFLDKEFEITLDENGQFPEKLIPDTIASKEYVDGLFDEYATEVASLIGGIE